MSKEIVVGVVAVVVVREDSGTYSICGVKSFVEG